MTLNKQWRRQWLQRFGIEIAISIVWGILYGFFSVFIYGGLGVFIFFVVAGVASVILVDNKYGPF